MFVSEQLFLVLLSIKCRPVLVIEHCLLCLRFHENVYIYIARTKLNDSNNIIIQKLYCYILCH